MSTQNRLSARLTTEFETLCFCNAETLESARLVSNASREMLSEESASGFLSPLKFEYIQIELYIKLLP